MELSDIFNTKRNVYFMTNKIDIKSIIERFPFLQSVEPDWPLIDLEIPRGWYRLFLQMCEDIRQPLLDAGKLYTFRFLQVKEKFNQLTCYAIGGTEEVQKILDKYAKMSRYVCSSCGKPATCETTDYILSYCNECVKELSKQAKLDWIIPETCYQITNSPPDRETYSMIISFKDEWERYLEVINNAQNRRSKYYLYCG